MSDTDDMRQLKEDWDALFGRILSLGRVQGQAEATAVLKEAMARLVGGAALEGASLVAQPTASQPVLHGDTSASFVYQPRSRVQSQRAAVGSVQRSVDDIMTKSPVPLTPLKIVSIGLERGISLKDSSVRMALITLREKRRVQQLGSGEWVSIAKIESEGLPERHDEEISPDKTQTKSSSEGASSNEMQEMLR